ncbi:MAG: hypothetical protein QOF02_2828 [Blastocatellia bacterium]|jgi:hypothetical protein|nr:hypothetical protein [Blastocatellia bacterium]
MSFYRQAFTLSLLLIACAATSAPRSAMAAHTFHTSLMSIEYNHQEQLLEISLEVYAHDLETILAKRAGKSVRLDKATDAEPLIFAYLQEAVTIQNGAGETKPLAWVGMETQTDRTWLYFESKLPEGLNGVQLRNRLFFELLADQINLVHLKDRDTKTDLIFKPGDTFKPLLDPPKS